MGAISQKGAEFLIRSRLADAEEGDVDALRRQAVDCFVMAGD